MIYFLKSDLEVQVMDKKNNTLLSTSTSTSLVDESMNDLISDLQILIRQPSISATNQGLIECAHLLSQIMQKAGIQTKLLYVEDSISKENGCVFKVPPIVFGEVKSKSNPNGKTILFYNHYDVQPIDPIEKWEMDPFSGKIEGNRIYGRGSSDDKGELITRLKAVEFFLKHKGDIPCNIKFVIEGEEEIGSPHLAQFLQNYNNNFKSDLVIWESGYIDTKGRAIISLGQKGILHVDMKSQGPNRDVHSSLAVVVENPAWKLINALSLIRDTDGKILVEGWYDEVKPLNQNELKLIDHEPFDEEIFKKEYGITNFVNCSSGFDIKKSLASEPTCNISGLSSGYVNEGVKTIIPSTASVKLDFRLVPYMDPYYQYEKLVKYLRSKGFSENDLKIKYITGEPAYKTPLENPYLYSIVEAAKHVFDDIILNISSPGTGPMYLFKKYLQVDSICIGSTILPNKMHSPNEFTNIDLLNKGTKCFIEIINQISQMQTNIT